MSCPNKFNITLKELASKLSEVAPEVQEIASYYIYKIQSPNGVKTIKSHLPYDEFMQHFKKKKK
jgi:hypothetical protein